MRNVSKKVRSLDAWLINRVNWPEMTGMPWPTTPAGFAASGHETVVRCCTAPHCERCRSGSSRCRASTYPTENRRQMHSRRLGLLCNGPTAPATSQTARDVPACLRSCGPAGATGALAQPIGRVPQPPHVHPRANRKNRHRTTTIRARPAHRPQRWIAAPGWQRPRALHGDPM